MAEVTKVRISLGNLILELEGNELFVKGELEWFKEGVLGKLDLETQLGIGAPEEGPEGQDRKTQGKKPPFKEFLKSKSPKTDMQAATVIAYYLAEFEGIGQIDGKVFREWSPKAGWKPPKNPQQTLADAKSKHGYFDKVKGKGLYEISTAGRYAVEQELPETK